MAGIAFFERRATLMASMLHRLDIDIAQACRDALGTTMQRATRTCVFCRSSDVCERWLSDPRDPGGYERFCPNADKFRRFPRRGAS